MPSIKPNARVIASAINGPRMSYTIEGHSGLGLSVRGNGNASWTLRYRVGGKQREHVLHNDARSADFQKIVTAKADWLARVKVDGIDPKAEQEAALAAKQAAEAAAKLAATNTFDSVVAGWTTWQEANGIRSAQQNRRQYELHVEAAL